MFVVRICGVLTHTETQPAPFYFLGFLSSFADDALDKQMPSNFMGFSMFLIRSLARSHGFRSLESCIPKGSSHLTRSTLPVLNTSPFRGESVLRIETEIK